MKGGFNFFLCFLFFNFIFWVRCNSEAIHTKGFLAGSISCDVGLLDLLEAGWFLEETISTEILSQNVCQVSKKFNLIKFSQ